MRYRTYAQWPKGVMPLKKDVTTDVVMDEKTAISTTKRLLEEGNGEGVFPEKTWYEPMYTDHQLNLFRRDVLLYNYKKALARHNCQNAEQGLLLLLEKYREHLPILNDEFRNSFRTYDPIEDKVICRAVWHMLSQNSAPIFWDEFANVCKLKDPNIPVLAGDPYCTHSMKEDAFGDLVCTKCKGYLAK